MATKKQKRAAGIAKREAFEAEQRASGLNFLALAQAGRAEERRKAEETRKDRAIAKSKRLARAYEAAKASQPGIHRTADNIQKTKENRKSGGRRQKQYKQARSQTTQEA